ncbi:hypothetical protein SAMN05216304_1011049 [Bosea sp. OK403]|uniref:DUF3024 domain-containing protein n=1 Tax=Bosea sp. OK403 TaxID=1855286 RepID=UPI0008F00FF4|nr:hypothetical protein [Bosea sp. OK403]SFI13804.1 hypothetical protein SAMN05216304_1011049 [Bosea sp. OK403]
MAGSERKWVRVKALTRQERSVIAASCERFIAETLKPRFLPEVRPTTFNYPIDIVGKWRGSKYSFITRYRSGFPENLGEEFDLSFSRLDHAEEHLSDLRFHVMWYRHTGQWFRLHALVTLDEALRLIASDERLLPL